MKYIRIFSMLLVMSILILGLHSCVKDYFDSDKFTNEVQWKPSLSTPVAWGNLSATGALEAYDSAGNFKVNEDGYLSVLFKKQVETDTVNKVLEIPTQGFNVQITEADFIPKGRNEVYTKNFAIPIELFNDDAEIDSIIMSSGAFNFSVNSGFGQFIAWNLSIPGLTKEGVPFQEDSYAPGGSTYFTEQLNGYKFDLTQTTANFNEIPVQLTITITNSPGSYSGSLDFAFNLNEPKYHSMFGYFGHNTLIFRSDKVDIDLFDDGDAAEIEDYSFEDPKFNVYYMNSYGIPSNFYFDSVVAHSDFHTGLYDITGDLPMDSLNPYNVSYASMPGEERQDSLQVDKDNSNIDDVVDWRPNWIRFIAHAHTNPGGESGHNNFITGESRFMADVQLELPLWGYIYNFSARDTSEFDFSEYYEDTEIIERLKIQLNIENGFPVVMEGQVYFLDEDYNILDSLIQVDDNRIIKAAEVDAEGRVLSLANKTTILEFTQDDVDDIKNTKHICFTGLASTTDASDEELVKIYDDYNIGFDISMEADLNVEVDLDTLNNEDDE